jgi:hypothetical protein
MELNTLNTTWKIQVIWVNKCLLCEKKDNGNLCLDANHAIVQAYKKNACRFQGVGRVGHKWVEEKMEVFHKEV